MDEPFVFISYSSQDNQRVWADALRFQQMGYNVWLDKKNLDKTQPSWRDDALEAIRDFNCALLVYYVSRSSLVSPACIKELECTVEDTTRAIHNGPVKFIAVDIEPIDNIIKFKDEVHGELARKKMDKAEKTAMAITLSKCINQFFNGNSEKGRVKAYSLPNREMDYYEEITADFPDETRIYKPKVEKTEPKTVVKEKTAAAPPVHGGVRSNNPQPSNFQNQSQQEPRPVRSAPTPPPAPKDADQLFEEKLKAFMRESDSRLSSMRAAQRINSSENPHESGTASARPTAPAMKTVKKTFSLEKAFADANQELDKDATNQFTAYKDVSEKRMRNFKKTMGIPIVNEVTGIEGLWGFGDGHETEGLVVDQAKLYYGTNLHSTVEYRKVTSVEFFLGDDVLLVHYEDSNIGLMIGPDTLCTPIKAFLQACVDQRT